MPQLGDDKDATASEEGRQVRVVLSKVDVRAVDRLERLPIAANIDLRCAVPDWPGGEVELPRALSA